MKISHPPVARVGALVQPIVIVGLVVGLLAWWHQSGLTPDTLRDLGRAHPYMFTVAIFLLPVFGMPISVFLIAAGLLYPLWKSTLLITVAMAFHMGVSYPLARHVFSDALRSSLERYPKLKRDISEKHHVWVTFVFFFVPGIPYAMKNYIVPLSSIPFRTYFFIGWPTQVLMGIVFVLVGDAVLKGQMGILVIVLAAALLLYVVGYTLRQSYLKG